MTRGLNKVMVIGCTGRNPEMRYTPSGKSVANFSLAYRHTWKDSTDETHHDTEWFNVIAWGKLAEFVKNKLQKGSLVYVEGRLQTRSWQDTEGNQKKTVEIVARDILILDEQQYHENRLESNGN